jgi:RHS repeat-associated protein
MRTAPARSISRNPTILILVCFFLTALCFVREARGQVTAADDFFVVDGDAALLSTSTNDQGVGNTHLTIYTAPQHVAVVGHDCGSQFANLAEISRFGQNGAYTGLETFQYRLHGCSTGEYSNAATVTVLFVPNDGAQDAGANCNSVGGPVNVTNGNVWLRQSDYVLPGVGDIVEVNRFYNSIIQRTGLFGFGWSTKYDESLEFYGTQMIRLNMPDGKATYFGRLNTSLPFTSYSPGVTGQIVQNQDGTYTLTYKDGRSRMFGATGKLQWQKDRNGNQTTLSYDFGGDLTAITEPKGRVLTVSTNGNGTVSQLSDSIGVVAAYTYFPSSTRLQTVTYPDGSKYQFEYAQQGTKFLLTAVKDAENRVLESHAYDAQGRGITSERQGGIEKYTLEYLFTPLNEPTTRVTEQVTSGPNPQTRVFGYIYRHVQGKDIITLKQDSCSCGGATDEQAYFYYDESNSWLNLKRTQDTYSRDTFYFYDSDRNLTRVDDPLGTQKWTYNTSVTDAANGNESYAYNAVGNRTSSQRSGSYSYQPFNRVSATQTATYGYDANGNTMSKSEGSQFWRYQWDHENRLIEAANRKQKVRYKYDALGRRVQRSVPGGRENTKYTHDGDDVLLDDDVAAGLTKYIDGPGIDNKLRSQTGSSASYFLADHVGSTNGIADAAGSLTASTGYDAYGTATNLNFPSRYQFTGREYDPVSKFYYYRARVYDPVLGRFMSEDPTGFRGGDINLYGYVWNNPNGFSDPLGFSGWGVNAANRIRRGVQVYRSLGLPDVSMGPGGVPDFSGSGPLSATGTALWLADLLTIGRDTGLALACDNLPDFRRFELISQDVVRAGELFLMLSGPAAGRFGGATIAADERAGASLRTRFIAGDDGVIHDLKPTLDRIGSGARFPHRNDGSVFGNREGLLPTQPHGYYTEYVHPTPGSGGPGAMRIVTGQGGEAWFTPNHYRTFIPIR